MEARLMIIAGIYSFKNGQSVVEQNYAAELDEIKQVIEAINTFDLIAEKHTYKTQHNHHAQEHLFWA